MKVGQVVECDFGNYRPDALGGHHVDGRIPPEMIKRRLAVLRNVKLGDGCVVVPVSSRHDAGKEKRGYHVRIHCRHIPATARWTPCERWAKAELMQYVSQRRLFTMRDDSKLFIKPLLPRELVAQIQRAVMRAIGGTGLLSLNIPAGIPAEALDSAVLGEHHPFP